MLLGLDSRSSGIKAPASAQEIEHVLEFGSYSYSRPKGWIQLRERLERMEGVVVEALYPRVYDSTSPFFTNFVIIGQCRINAESAKYNIVEFSGFDECETITMMGHAKDHTVYAVSVEHGEDRYTMSRTPEELKGVMLLPAHYNRVKGYKKKDVTRLRIPKFEEPDGFKRLCELVSQQAKQAGTTERQKLWESFTKALKSDIDADELWGVPDGNESLAEQVEQLKELFQMTSTDNWVEKVFQCLEERVELLMTQVKS